jgi:hypothetical protein
MRLMKNLQAAVAVTPPHSPQPQAAAAVTPQAAATPRAAAAAVTPQAAAVAALLAVRVRERLVDMGTGMVTTGTAGTVDKVRTPGREETADRVGMAVERC